MGLDQVANIAEIIGVVLVVLTLIFLTLQIRQNTRAIRASTMKSALQSEMEFAADIWPNQYGSSTGGVIKSTVLIMAISSVRRYTAASSAVSIPTRRLGSSGGVSPSSASDRSVGPILAAHPQVRDKPINVFFFTKSMTYSLCS